MEFTVVTHHTDIHSCSNGLKDMRIVSIPEALLVYTGCKDKEQFGESIVHLAFAYEHIEQLIQHKYCSVNGTFIFRHADSFNTAVMSMCSEKILLETGDMYCINKIHNIAWQDDHEICLFIGVIESKIRLNIVKWQEVRRNDCKYYAIPSACVTTISSAIKSQLKFLRCEFNVNVAYKENEASQTHRSLLLPTTLICTDKIPHNDLYSIVCMTPHPAYVLTSSLHEDVFGVKMINEGRHHDFETWISQYHTAEEMERIKSSVLPRMRDLESGKQFRSVIEFATPKGLTLFDVCIRSIGRMCLVVTFNEHPLAL